MPQIKIPKGALEPRPSFAPGLIQVQVRGFKPEKSKKGDSINLNPQLAVVNDNRQFPDGRPYNGQSIPTSLNTQFFGQLFDFCHCFGVPMPEDKNGDRPLPGSYGNGDLDEEPRLWGPYSGPLKDQIGTLELVEVPARHKAADGTYVPDGTRTRAEIKRFICNVPGCQERHNENLIR